VERLTVAVMTRVRRVEGEDGGEENWKTEGEERLGQQR
jgi:hypothetical protein